MMKYKSFGSNNRLARDNLTRGQKQKKKVLKRRYTTILLILAGTILHHVKCYTCSYYYQFGNILIIKSR